MHDPESPKVTLVGPKHKPGSSPPRCLLLDNRLYICQTTCDTAQCQEIEPCLGFKLVSFLKEQRSYCKVNAFPFS